ncbi:TonB-dependent receptor [Sphingomonas sp. MG17]|uniref:TonB-dependent receptor n=1 Tax=Sphingomonas tagetis TaxID=2949092 RepID=A0A9X2KKZ3_9SPHN|nr:TonB-dependent receptor [Sphingomonas tagetis]MCP3729881.1 TonB-dependent receptor [Sphingomonas tagetis]
MVHGSIARRFSKFQALTGVAAVALAATPALAQTAPPQAAEPQEEQAESGSNREIVVTATRVVRDGYAAPTPVTVFGEEDLARAGQSNVFQAVNQLPSLAGSNSTQTFGTTQSTGTGGLSTLNLRGLGTNRTLTLLNGQRVVGALNIGVTDAGSFPQGLVKRVDIVTGGASASWGSDAVAGVVNYILDDQFVGLKGNINGGVTTYGDNKQYSVSLTGGFRFANDRAHFVISGEYQDNDGVPRGSGKRDWYDGTKVLMRTIATTPAGEPQYIVAPRVVDTRLAPGGVITAGPLRGTAFGPGGAPFAFQYGTIVGVDMSGGTQIGDIADNSNLEAAMRRETIYARLGFDITDDVTLWGSFNYGGVLTTAHSFPGQYRTGTLTIQCGNALNGAGSLPGSGANPFVPASIQQACINNNITSFAMGSYIADLPDTIAVNERNMHRFAVGLDGSFEALGSDWKFNAYGAIGKTYTKSLIQNNTLTNLVFAAIDAIPGPNGTVICRSAAARAAGCVPLNVIGTGVASQAALNWIKGEPWIKTWLQQDVAALNLSGEPFSNWAGPVSIAFGVEYRRESFRQESDPFSVGNGGNTLLNAGGNNYFTGNFRSSQGAFHVWEGYLETVLPLFDGDGMGKAELSGAVRATQYSQSGYVTTWKAGGTWDTPLTGLRLRGVVSRDIRAPNLAELFRAPANLFASFTDFVPQAPGQPQTYDVNQATVSNLDLRPEKSNTFEIGAIYRPEWLPGFSASVDFYRIKVTDAISTLSGIQQVATLCQGGNADACAAITRNPAGKATEIRLVPINISSLVTKGLDIEASYRTEVPALIGSNGSLTIRALATHVFNYTNTPGLPGTVPQEQAGVNSNAVNVSIPNWRLYATQSYSTDRFSFTVIERYVSPGVIANNFIECASACPLPTATNPTINNNQIAGATYVDIGATFKITPKIEIYGKVDNLFNIDPPLVPYYGINPYLVRSVNNSMYDLLGRFYRVGVRFSL